MGAHLWHCGGFGDVAGLSCGYRGGRLHFVEPGAAVERGIDAEAEYRGVVDSPYTRSVRYHQHKENSDMPLFSSTIDTFWQATFLDGEAVFGDELLTVVANAKLVSDRRVMVLRKADGMVNAVLTPDMVEKLGFHHHKVLTELLLREKMREANIQLHDADYVFHFTEAGKHALLQEPPQVSIRQLGLADQDVFTQFQSQASEQDLDDAYVELDHWAVFGSFENERLVCAASMYPWSGAPVADLGVLTLPPHRGMGHARGVVRAICRFAYGQGFEPQYRCQTDNASSVSLAKSAGLTLFGTWEVVSPECAA